MTSKRQAIKNRSHIKNKLKFLPFKKSIHKKGTIQKFVIWKPKKPNSARRKVARVKLSSGIDIWSYIPTENHKLKVFVKVLIKISKVPDLPCINTRLVLNKYDFFKNAKPK